MLSLRPPTKSVHFAVHIFVFSPLETPGSAPAWGERFPLTEAVFIVHGSSSILESTVPFYPYTLDVYDTMADTVYMEAFNDPQFYKSNRYTNKRLKFAHTLILCIKSSI